MRRAILSVSIALLATAGVTAAGWALQAAALPPPKPAALIAADASEWLHQYRFVVDVFHFDHRRTEGACLRGWFRRSQGRKVRESLLSLESGTVLRASPQGRVAVARGSANRLLPGRLAVAAGCTGRLEGALGAAAQGGANLTAERAYAAGRPAVALEWSRGRDRHEAIYVSPQTARPLVAILELAGRNATARLFLARARPPLLERYHLPVSRPPRRMEQ